jgi:hypothetical protein
MDIPCGRKDLRAGANDQTQIDRTRCDPLIYRQYGSKRYAGGASLRRLVLPGRRGSYCSRDTQECYWIHIADRNSGALRTSLMDIPCGRKDLRAGANDHHSSQRGPTSMPEMRGWLAPTGSRVVWRTLAGEDASEISTSVLVSSSASPIAFDACSPVLSVAEGLSDRQDWRASIESDRRSAR